MINTIQKLVIATSLVFTSVAGAEMATDQLEKADQIIPLEAHTLRSEDVTAVVYYTLLDNGNYEVVTTVGPNEGANVVATQHRTTLQVGQSYSVELAQDGSTDSLLGIHLSAGADSLSVAAL